MKTIKCKLTVYFAEPFWVGVFERICDGKLSVAKVSNGVQGVQTRLKRKDRFESK